MDNILSELNFSKDEKSKFHPVFHYFDYIKLEDLKELNNNDLWYEIMDVNAVPFKDRLLLLLFLKRLKAKLDTINRFESTDINTLLQNTIY